MFEKILESPLDSKEIKLVSPKGNQSWIFIERIDAEAEALVLWPPDVKIWLTGKDPDAGKEWKQKEKKGTTEDKTLVWYNWLSGQEFEQILGDGEGQQGLACCSPWGPKELDTTEWLNWTELSNHESNAVFDISFILIYLIAAILQGRCFYFYFVDRKLKPRKAE